MNRKKMSVVIVSVTVITVLVMLICSSFSKGIDTEDDKTLILNNYNNMKNASLEDENNNNKSSIKSNSIDAKNDNNTNNNQASGSLDYKYEAESDNYVDKSNVSKQYDSSPNNTKDVNETKDKSEMPLFKVSKEKIVSQLSFSDKVKILSISKNLSPSDLNKLQNDINDNNEKEGISDAMQLLKTRLDNKDFNNIKNIASRFIDLDDIKD